MKNLLITLIVACVLLSCNSQKNEKLTETPLRDIETNIIEDSNSLNEATIYLGTLPCADCSGIETVLKIYQGDGTIESHKFELTSIYKGKPSKNFVDHGNFNLERGLENDPDGTIYVLNWDQPESRQIYYGVFSHDSNKIYLLNNKREIIKSDLNYSLVLKK
ncbi:copper resistance protein NlpE [Flavobacterium sp. N1736]|uniref:copper resistance protein NlpE n=1 Tax=Flavobacterium sp. N1736 TaxID=2986823 RepID=UPI0022252238|nr:copper resistance protein NlpE [Flavobacterium sp. N1736]